MIYEKPGGGRQGLPRHANRELAVALVLFACAAAMVVSYGLSAYCDGRSGWPCLPRHAANRSEPTPSEDDASAINSGASGFLPPLADATGPADRAVPAFPTPSAAFEMPTSEYGGFVAPSPSPTREPQKVLPLPNTPMPFATATLLVITVPPPFTVPGSTTPDVSGEPTGEDAGTPSGTTGTPTTTATATPTGVGYPKPGG